MGVMFSEEEKADKNKAVWNFEPPAEAKALKAKETKASRIRMRTLLQMEGGDPDLDLGIYGLGTKRTYKEFAAFSGTDPSLLIRSAGEQCGDARWVPWDWDFTPKKAAETVDDRNAVESGEVVNNAGTAKRGGAIDDSLEDLLPDKKVSESR
jgi:hypothetical protein